MSSQSRGAFPDLAIKINVDDDVFTGGELVEFKGSQAYNIASFNSIIPRGKKAILDVINESQKIKKQMEKAGNKIKSMPVRDVYYLISGRKGKDMKVILVHGSFFETIPVRELIRRAFAKILKEANPSLDEAEITRVSKLFAEQKLFSQVRHIDKASVSIRFRIMTEAEGKANLLNPNIYPEIKTNTVNLCIPYRDHQEKNDIINKFKIVLGTDQFDILELTHKISKDKFVLFQGMIKK